MEKLTKHAVIDSLTFYRSDNGPKFIAQQFVTTFGTFVREFSPF